MGYNATQSLIISQIVLSLALPVPMIALLVLTRRADVMGEFVNGRLTAIGAFVGTTVVLALNLILIVQTLGVPLPFLAASG